MFIRNILYLLLLSFATIIQCQSSLDIGTCSCDLTKGVCDTSCCCDTDCSANDIKTFKCDSKSTTCFKDIPIYKSNSPHVVQKKGDLVCVDHQQNVNTDSAHYEKMINAQTVPSALTRSINLNNSVSSPVGTATNLTVYEAGTSVFRFISTSQSTYYTLPVKLFNSAACLGSQPITYLNDFTSTCYQPVTAQTCPGVLNPANYLTSSFCLVTLPSTLAGSTPSSVCCSATPSPSSWTSPTCSGALQNLNLIIYYSNPNGIVGCSANFNTTTGTLNSQVLQTFTVNFLKNGSSVSSTVRSGNPGYIPGDPIIAGNLNGNSITTLSGLTILQASASGGCSGTNVQVISFGQNVQSTCLYTPTCPDLTAASSVFMSYNFINLYVAGKGNSDPTNTSDSWLLVTFCTSQIGSTNGPVCQTNSLPTSIVGQCYTRLDVQIVFANFGSVTNPQPIIGAVIYHFQSIAQTTPAATAFLMTQTITFQDVSNSPVTQGDQIPRPNVRLPGDFFYPFTLNRAANPIVFSSIFYLSIFFLFFLM